MTPKEREGLVWAIRQCSQGMGQFSRSDLADEIEAAAVKESLTTEGEPKTHPGEPSLKEVLDAAREEVKTWPKWMQGEQASPPPSDPFAERAREILVGCVARDAETVILDRRWLERRIDYALRSERQQAARETVEKCARYLETTGVFLEIVPGETKQERCQRFAMAMAKQMRGLASGLERTPCAQEQIVRRCARIADQCEGVPTKGYVGRRILEEFGLATEGGGR